MDNATVVICDDHPIVRDGLVAVLQDQADLEVVGAAGTAEEAVALAGSLQPDVVLLDLELPGMGGVEAIPRLADAALQTRVIVFTAYDADEQVFGAIRAGAKATRSRPGPRPRPPPGPGAIRTGLGLNPQPSCPASISPP